MSKKLLRMLFLACRDAPVPGRPFLKKLSKTP